MQEADKRQFRGNGRDKSQGGEASVAGILSLEREKPHNEEAEIAVLGAMLIDGNAASVGMGRLNFPNAFYRQAHQIIFDAMVALNPKGDAGMDPVVLADYLRRNNQLDLAGGTSYLAMLMDKTPTAAHIEHYIEIVKQNAILRRVIATCADAIMKCYEADGKAEVLLDQIEKDVMAVSQMNERKDYLEIQPLVKNALRYITDLMNPEKKAQMGIPTGYAQLDISMTGGLQPGMLFVLAARPSIGKTALALNMAYNIATKGVPVGIFSLEMSADQLTLRLISSGAEVNIGNLAYSESHSNEDILKIQATCEKLTKTNIVIDETGGIDILELRSKARRMVEKHGVKVLFIDYLQLITINSANRNASRENDVARISGSLKALAKELEIPVVVLAQVNRASEQGDGQPKLSNLRESGAIEQDADVVALLHRNRDEQYAQTTDSSQGLDAVLLIAKNRNGRTGKQPLTFYPSFTRFVGKDERASDEDIPR